MNTINNFTFMVLTYNHCNYILEHLESIKYLIENYGDGISIDIIIADDVSRDSTVALSKFWLDQNSYLFNKVTVLSDGTNKGTCKNLVAALKYLSTDYCKITAGDDVYSYENIFFESKKLDFNHILSGLPLNLIDGVIKSTRFGLFNLFATDVIYRKYQYITRLQRISFFNSPSIFYSVQALVNKNITNFVAQYSVTEDYPLQIKMAELYKPLRFMQIEKIFVYYRRTGNSTYIIKNSAFSRDKVDIFNYLIESEGNVFEKFLLGNRLFCYRLGNKYLKRIFDLNFYLYGLNVLKNLFLILGKLQKFDCALDKHQNHYDLIASKAKNYTLPQYLKL
jgi:Glycosyl transferase family 2